MRIALAIRIFRLVIGFHMGTLYVQMKLIFSADQTNHSFVKTMASFLRKYPLLSGCLPVITNRNCFVPAELKEYLPRRSVFMAEFGAY